MDFGIFTTKTVISRLRQNSWQVWNLERNQGTNDLDQLSGIYLNIAGIIEGMGKLQGQMEKRAKIILMK